MFCDVLKESGTSDPDLVEDMLSKDENIGTVLAVHLFSNAAQMSRLKATCTAHQSLLIEDLAQDLVEDLQMGPYLVPAAMCPLHRLDTQNCLTLGMVAQL